MTKPQLPVYEWGIIAIVISALLFLGFVTYTNHHHEDIPVFEEQSTNVTVSAAGSVNRPGAYVFNAGATVEELLEQIEPNLLANLSKLNTKRKLKDGEHFQIPEKPSIKIYLEGAIQKKGLYILPKGTKFSELPDLVEVFEEADLDKIRSIKQKLKNDEVVFIPYRNS